MIDCVRVRGWLGIMNVLGTGWLEQFPKVASYGTLLPAGKEDRQLEREGSELGGPRWIVAARQLGGRTRGDRCECAYNQRPRS